MSNIEIIEEKSRFQQLLEKGEFAVTAEIGPPMSANAALVTKKAQQMKGFVDAANITDNQTAIVRMSSIAASVLVKEAGVEPIMQMTCRDRNRIGIQSDLLGAWALGVRNILCLSGDHQTFGNDPGAKNVYDIDSIQLVKTVADMRDNGIFLSGKPIKVPPKFFVGASTNPFADPVELQLIRLQKKIDAGAQFIQTQTIYDVERFADYMKEIRARGLHERAYIQAGVLVNKTAKSIEMTAQVPGMIIPDKLIQQMKQVDKEAKIEAADLNLDPDETKKLVQKKVQEAGVSIASDIIHQVRQIEGVSGIHIMAVNWEDIVPTVVDKSGYLPRPELNGGAKV
ncbi:MAG: methylenetetrahydrofolate reductase [Eubacterium sp.]|nr:methylenetetrahydrofolate reductase [Eubacterium sp.]